MENLQEGQRVEFEFRGSIGTGTILCSETPHGVVLYRVLPDGQEFKKYIHEQLGRSYFLFRRSNVTPLELELEENNPNLTFKISSCKKEM